MNKKRIQLIINIVVIINITIITIIIYNMIINNKYSEKFAYELMQKNLDINNFILEKEEITKEGLINKTRIIQNGEVCREEIDDEIRWYANDFVIINRGNEKYYYKQKVESLDENGNISYGYMTTKEEIWRHSLRYILDPYSLTNSTKYKYLKKEKYNDMECIIIEINEKRIWIDTQTGFKLREEIYADGILECIKKYKVETNVVTDEIIALPNLEEYIWRENWGET